MGKLKDLRGHKFGRLTVVSQAHSVKCPCGTTKAIWNCICECGTITTVRSESLRNSRTQSCGCLVVETSRALRVSETRHGHSKLGRVTPTYRTWRAMMGRCLNTRHKDFQRYGACGISVCQDWLSFENFLADMGERLNGTTLDRIDTCGNYELKNCRWAIPSQQSQNQTSTKLTPTIVKAIRNDCRVQHEIAKQYHVSQTTVSNIKLGKSWTNI